MNFVPLLRPMTLTHNNKVYNPRRVDHSNNIKFLHLRYIMERYSPQEFLDNFDEIYNSQVELQPICYAIYTIYKAYSRDAKDSNNIPGIINGLEKMAKHKLGRKNSKYFHIKLVGYVCLWCAAYSTDLGDTFKGLTFYFDLDFIKDLDWFEFFRYNIDN